jgi:PAS domain S-box-containing protein
MGMQYYLSRILGSSPAVILMIAFVYAVVAKASFLFTIPPGNISPIFPAAGIALAAAIILGRNALIGIWLGSFLANTVSFIDGTVSSRYAVLPGLLIGSFIGIGAMSGAKAGAFLARRFCKEETSLSSGWNVLILVTVGALGCCMISPTFGVVSLLLGGYIPWERFGYSWITWWAGDAAGAIVAAPLILAWHYPHPFRKNPSRIIEAAVLGGATLFLCLIIFFRNLPFAYALMPLLLWAAFRFGMRGVTTTAAAIAIFATIGTSVGSSPFVRDTVNESLLFLHSFLVVTISCSLFLAGVLAERKRAEEASRASESKYRELVENANSIVLYWARDGRILFLNEFGQKFFGYSAREIIGRHVMDTIVPETDSTSHDLRSLMDQITANPKAFEQNINENIRRNGERVWIAWTNKAVRDEQDQITEVLSIGQDITERKRAEEALRQSEERLRLLGDNLPDSFVYQVILHPEGNRRFLYISAGVERILGVKAAAILQDAAALYQQTAQEQLPALTQMEEVCLRDQIDFEMELRICRADGQWRWFQIRSRPRRNFTGQIIWDGVATDITDRKRAEEEIRRLSEHLQHYTEQLEQRVAERTAELAVAKDRAELADRLKSAFLATMSHELRTPLNSILGFTGILLQDLAGPLNREQRKQLEMVRNSARHLLSLINDVLDISKIEAGQLEVNRELFDLRATIMKVAGIVKPLAEKKDLALRVELAPEIGSLVSDSRRIEQVLLNLLNNAIKFTERGEVTLTADIVLDALDTPHSAIRIVVADTGIGIKPEDTGKLFQPFRQIDSGLARQHEGTGLGLAICRRLAELLGGEICVASDWGKGSVFTLTLPLKGQAES